MDKIISVGQISNKGSQAGKVYSTEGLFPTICACTHGYAIGNILEDNMNDYQVLRKVRTDYGKEIRKEYESGNIDEKIGNMTRYEPRADGMSNTLTTVQKDNYVIEYCNSEVSEVNELIFKGGIGDKDWIGDGKFYSRNYPQGNRVYSDEGLACSQTANGGGIGGKTGLYEISERCEDMSLDTSKPNLVGGVGEINFGQQYRQGNRIYDGDSVGMCLMAQPVGNAGGYSYLYKINKNEGGNNMWNNNLEKFSFDMKKIKVFDAFFGIGALHKSLTKLGVPVEISSSSEIEIDAIIDYGAIHMEGFKNLEFEYPTEIEMREWLIARNIGYSFEKDKSSIPRLKKDKLYNVYKACILLNNFGDISRINPSEMPDFDLMNFSFSCTDLSNAGKQQGMKNADGTPTRSGLYVYGMNIIKAKKPKYIMIENVKGLIQKKFIDDFYSIVDELKELGYTCYYPTKEDKKGVKSPTCLNSKNYGIPQNRDRIFVICVRDDIDSGGFEFPKGFDSGVRLKDVLDKAVDEKYYLSQEIQDRFKLNGKKDVEQNELNVVGSSAPECRTIGQRDITYGVNGIMSTLTATDYKQPKQILENDIVKLFDIPKEILNDNERQRRVYSEDGIAPTTLARADSTKIVDNKINVVGNYMPSNHDASRVVCESGIAPTVKENYGTVTGVSQIQDMRIRRLTPKECFRLMGFDDEDFEKAKEMGTSDSMLYKQAGNSIVVNVLYYIFKELFKEYIVD